MSKKKRGDEPRPGLAPWMATFSDLMNLLLCFFVMLFAMSSIEEEKFREIAASFSSSFSIFEGGSTSITDGNLISSGISQLNEFNDYYNNMGLSQEQYEDGKIQDMEQYRDQLKEDNIKDSEALGDEIQDKLNGAGVDDVNVEVEEYYVQLTLNGELFFDPGSAELKPAIMDTMSKLGDILKGYEAHNIEIIGHTDTVPMTGSTKYVDNWELSQGRAYSVLRYLTGVKGLSMKNMACSGQGEYQPVATNETAEGRRRNRRVEIKIYNRYQSGLL